MRYSLFAAMSFGMMFVSTGASGTGLDFAGWVDGLVAWDLETLEPGESASRTVIFAFAKSRDELISVIGREKDGLAQRGVVSANGWQSCAENIAFVENSVTNFALESSGSLRRGKGGVALGNNCCGEIRQFAWRIGYDDGGDKKAGIAMRSNGGSRMLIKGDGLDNIRIVEPVRKHGQNQAISQVETTDGKIRLSTRVVMGKGPAAIVEFVVVNISSQPLTDVGFRVFSAFKAGDGSWDDYSVLDPEIDGVFAVDESTGACLAMAAVERPDAGFCGVWIEPEQLTSGEGIRFKDWRSYGGIPEDLSEQAFKARWLTGLYVEPKEPVTRTLSKDQAQGVLERDWLFQAEDKPLTARTIEEIGWTKGLASRLSKNPEAPEFRKELGLLQIMEQMLVSLGESELDERTARKIYLTVRRVKRSIMFKNPVVDFSQVLFIDNPFPMGQEWKHEATHRNGRAAVAGGRLLVLDGLDPGGRIRKLAPEKPGSFWRPDLSFDADKVLFCFKGHGEKAYHLYEIGMDGGGLKQLTYGDYDDLDPIYLPSGQVMFSTARANTYIRCGPYIPCFVLARCEGDGSNIRIISQGNESEWLPTLLHDGRVIYSRWEYTDKALWRVQSLWTTNQDGTGTATFWGNQSVWPDHPAEARPIPGSSRVMFTGTAHHNWFVGSIGILDTRKGFNFPHGLTKVTCETPWPESGEPPLDPHEAEDYHSSGKFTAYKTPYPLSEEDFLVSACDGDKFKLYLMDVHGNRELIYEGAYNIWHAMPIKARRRPPAQVDRVAWPGMGDNRKEQGYGDFYSSNVYQGVRDLPVGKARYLRVMQSDHKTYSTWFKTARFSGPGISVIQAESVKRVLGTVPIERDGSVYFKVPSGRALHFQLLDEHYRALQTMRTFTGVMPGEKRGCVGCHEQHSIAPANKVSVALRHGPSELTPPPWGNETVGYERFVQPVLDKYCGECHQGDGKARKKLDLTLREDDRWVYKEPYLTLVGGANWGRDGAKDTIAGAIRCESFGTSDPNSLRTMRPMKYLAYRSKLVDYAMSGKHHEVKVDALSVRKLIAWVDANCPYRGDEEVRAIADPDFPGIGLLAIRPKVRTAPVIDRP